MRVLVTGAAGFIGYHTCKRLLERGDQVVGIDNLNDYYDVALKRARLEQLTDNENYSQSQLDIQDRDAIRDLHPVSDLVWKESRFQILPLRTRPAIFPHRS